jgi:hypothetical protein
MTISKSALFINEPIEKLALRNRGLKFNRVETHNEVFLYVGGTSEQTATFGLTADFDAPEGAIWTQILVEEGENARKIAKILHLLKLRRGKIQSSSTWEGVPLLDVARINRYLALEKQMTISKGKAAGGEKKIGRLKLKTRIRRLALAA